MNFDLTPTPALILAESSFTEKQSMTPTDGIQVFADKYQSSNIEGSNDTKNAALQHVPRFQESLLKETLHGEESIRQTTATQKSNGIFPFLKLRRMVKVANQSSPPPSSLHDVQKVIWLQ